MAVFDALILGAGFGGLHALHRLRSDGLKVVALDAAADTGGAWYWNRYPGARCDVESLLYCYAFSPILDEEWTWSEKYAARDEICRYLQWVADRLDLRKDVRFNTRVTGARWDDQAGLWEVASDSGNVFRARHFITSPGPISEPIMPNIPGMPDYLGQLIHTARWPHADPSFEGKRVGVIGTGSSGTQLIPLVAAACKHLTVFLRTPNFYIPARNRPLTTADYEWWRENRAKVRARAQTMEISGAGDVMLDEDVNRAKFKKAASFSHERRRAIMEERWRMGGAAAGFVFSDVMRDRAVNDELSDFLREKIPDAVKDPAVAALLTPRGFAYGTKRPTVGTDYYETFNRPNVTIVDVKSTPIERFTRNGVAVDGDEIELDIVIAASGFDALTGALTAIDIKGIEGRSLKERWQDGPHTYLGICTSGFPNLYMIGGPGSPSVLTNVVMTNEMQVGWIADLIGAVERSGKTRCEVAPKAEASWTDTVQSAVKGNLWETAESWYVGANVPGKARVILAYAGGYPNYKMACDNERERQYPSFVLS